VLGVSCCDTHELPIGLLTQARIPTQTSARLSGEVPDRDFLTSTVET